MEARCKNFASGIHPDVSCPVGVAEGTTVSAFLRTSCQPHFIYDIEEAREAIASLVADRPYLYMVYDGGFGVPFDAPAAFTVVLGTSTREVASRLSLDADGRVIGLMRCSSAYPEVADEIGGPGDNQVILAPVPP
jgi:hypothetical protein